MKNSALKEEGEEEMVKEEKKVQDERRGFRL